MATTIGSSTPAGTPPTIRSGSKANIRPLDLEGLLSLIGLYKLDTAHFCKIQIFGGTRGIVLSVPYSDGSLSAFGTVGGPAESIKDTNPGFGDPAITPLIG